MSVIMLLLVVYLYVLATDTSLLMYNFVLCFHLFKFFRTSNDAG